MLHNALNETAAELAQDVTGIADTLAGWRFMFQGAEYAMREPYPEMVRPSDEAAPRLCVKALIQGTATIIKAQ